MATIKEDGYLQNLSDQDLQKKFRETLKELDDCTLRLEQSNNFLGSLESELIKRAVRGLKK